MTKSMFLCIYVYMYIGNFDPITKNRKFIYKELITIVFDTSS